MIERLEVKNFTAFTDLSIGLSPRINVIIGENGTGKTHLLKAAYALCLGASFFKDKPDVNKNELGKKLTDKLLRLFMPLEDKLGKMHHQGAAGQAYMAATFDLEQKIAATFSNKSRSLAIRKTAIGEQYLAKAVFIPTKEVLSLVKGMTAEDHDQKTVNLIFDDGYVDLANAMMKPDYEDIDEMINKNPRLYKIIPEMVNIMGGRYQLANGGFCFQAGQYKEKESTDRSTAKAAQLLEKSRDEQFVINKGHLYSSAMTAEGFRKIGILHRLLSNGTISLESSGSLFWDEPESNMNPQLMKLVVSVLLELSRNRQQIILATHDYVLPKWFDLLMDKGKEDHVRFHVLYRENESTDVKVESSEDYGVVSGSGISNAFAELYDEDVKRALGR